MADELVRPETDRLLHEALEAHLGAGRERPVEGHEIGVRLVQVEPHAIGTDDFDLADLLLWILAPLDRWKLNFTSSAVKGSPL